MRDIIAHRLGICLFQLAKPLLSSLLALMKHIGHACCQSPIQRTVHVKPHTDGVEYVAPTYIDIPEQCGQDTDHFIAMILYQKQTKGVSPYTKPPYIHLYMGCYLSLIKAIWICV